MRPKQGVAHSKRKKRRGFLRNGKNRPARTVILDKDGPLITALTISNLTKSTKKLKEMSAEDKIEAVEEPHATGHRWMVPMDFSFQANAALDWVFSVMKPEDHLLILNVLNLKAPTYAHDIAVNEKLKRESQEKLAEMKTRAIEKGCPYVNTLCVRGEPAQQVCKYAVEDKIDCIVMGRRGMSNLKRMLNGSVSEYVLANAPCAVCIMGKDVEEKVKAEELKKQDEEIAELSASCSENEGDDKKVPMFLPRKHSEKNYYTDSD